MTRAISVGSALSADNGQPAGQSLATLVTKTDNINSAIREVGEVTNGMLDTGNENSAAILEQLTAIASCIDTSVPGAAAFRFKTIA